jgi:DNA-binding NtrC family response regulator
VERRAIEQALAQCRGNVAGASRMLSISRTTLYSKLNDGRKSRSALGRSGGQRVSPKPASYA